VDGIRRLVPPAHRPQADLIMRRLRDSWMGWMQGVAVDMLVFGVLLYIGLRLIGLDFAIFFAVLTALLSVVPYFGAIVSAIPPVLFAFTDSPGKALLVIVVYTLVQQVEGRLTIPVVITILVEEIWVKPIEGDHRRRAAGVVALPPAVEEPEGAPDLPETGSKREPA